MNSLYFVQMNDLLLYLFALLPVAIICWIIFRLDKFEKEPIWPLVIAFLIGGLSTVPILFWESWVSTTSLEQDVNIWKTIIIAFLVVAASEEFVKSLGIYLYPFQQSFFNERMDGIIYGVMVAMGFAAVENVFYAYQHDWTTILVRAFTAVPTHAVFGVITGYYFGLAKFNKEKKWHYILRGLLIAIGLHGLYDFFIIQQIHEELMGGALLVLGFSVYLSFEMVKLHRQNSEESKLEFSENEFIEKNDLENS